MRNYSHSHELFNFSKDWSSYFGKARHREASATCPVPFLYSQPEFYRVMYFAFHRDAFGK